MNRSDAPKKQAVPFGVNGQREDLLSTTPAGDNTASYDAGFPAVTMILKAAGGLPPKGQDMNQILYELASVARWLGAGAGYAFDSAFSTTVGGYPLGAKILSSDGAGYWISTSEANSSNPEVATGALTGWAPSGFYGTSSIAGLAAASVTLTSLQAARDRIELAGTLTANINIVVPAWRKQWSIVNNCTGAFTVTVKTPSGTGVSIPTGLTANVIGNGTNITQDNSLLGYSGRLLNIQTFYASATYIPTSGTTNIVVELLGGGGGGGSNANTSGSSTSASAAGGGGGATYAVARMNAQSYSVTVGTGGNGAAAVSSTTNGGTGAAGGASSMGGVSAPGGLGGPSGVSLSSLPGPGNTTGTSPAATGSTLFSVVGGPGTRPVVHSSTASVSGSGGASFYGLGADGKYASPGGVTSSGYDASSFGAGGSGGCSIAGAGGISSKGGNGSSGIVIIWEYA